MRQLIDACPEPVTIGLNLTSKTLVNGEWVARDTRSVEEQRYQRNCIDWLRSEGLIRGADQYVVTLKGMELFKALPECIKN
ncbi:MULTISPECIES: hypothetical protein [unclassified Pseudomonas]|uniref:hypothetical protein n=1 Tax=unclassified Pseudomonas TaxID=196821 RepID=UPI001A9FFFAD|nr:MULTISPECIES: hypothetical protein [unclassified Pseudomonas]